MASTLSSHMETRGPSSFAVKANMHEPQLCRHAHVLVILVCYLSRHDLALANNRLQNVQIAAAMLNQ